MYQTQTSVCPRNQRPDDALQDSTSTFTEAYLPLNNNKKKTKFSSQCDPNKTTEINHDGFCCLLWHQRTVHMYMYVQPSRLILPSSTDITGLNRTVGTRQSLAHQSQKGSSLRNYFNSQQSGPGQLAPCCQTVKDVHTIRSKLIMGKRNCLLQYFFSTTMIICVSALT